MEENILDIIKNYHTQVPVEGVEKKYYDYIKGKRVAVVGPSPWLNGRKMGKYIDTFDIVVRINQGIFLPENYSEDNGSRTDIIYLSQRARDKYQEKFTKHFDDVKYISVLVQRKFDDYPPVQMACYKCNKEIVTTEEYCLNEGWDETRQPQIGHTNCIFPNLNREYVKYNMTHTSKIIKREFSYPQYKFGVSLLTGLLAVIEMIEFQAEQVEVIGFDFYQSIKESIRTKKNVVDATQMYCKGYRVIKQSLNMSHKDVETDQFNLFLHLYNSRQEFDTELLIDKNLKAIIKEAMSPQQRFTDHDEAFKNYIKGKKVAFVGPGSFLQGKELGWLIDSFDIVVRPNMSIFLTEEKFKDLGKRTNIVYLNQNLRGRFGVEFPTPMKQACDFIVAQSFIAEDTSSKVASVVYKCKQCKKPIEFGQEYYTDSGVLDSESYHFNCYKFIDYRLTPYKVVTFDSNKIMRDHSLKESPLVGFAAIVHLLEQEPAQLYVFNIDFYDSLKKKIIECRKLKTTQVKVCHTDLYTAGYQIMGGLTEEHKDADGSHLKEFIKLYEKNKNILHTDEHLTTIINEWKVEN